LEAPFQQKAKNLHTWGMGRLWQVYLREPQVKTERIAGRFPEGIAVMKSQRIFVYPIIATGLFLSLWGGRLGAETGKVNIHLEVGPAFAVRGWQGEQLDPGLYLSGMLEWAFIEKMGLEIGVRYAGFYDGYIPPSEQRRKDRLVDGSSYLAPLGGMDPMPEADGSYFLAIPIGLRFRPFNDEKGYLLAWSGPDNPGGNIWGNLWVDGHFDYYYTEDLDRLGFDWGFCYEFSLVTNLQLGPFFRMMYAFQKDGENATTLQNEDAVLLIAGLSVSIAIGRHGPVDTDGDGILDPDDACPRDPEDKDGFEDEDGCPDLDNDADGILDVQDACPNDPEDKDGFEDEDGCPDEDNDKDGILDINDKCINDPEDKDGFEDEDGCPDLDNDKDGIPDKDDKCPNEAENKNGIEDEDGCPEGDRDADGIIDPLDKCPDEPETINGVDDEDGCPDKAMVQVDAGKILTEKIYFELDKYRILRKSYAVLEELGNLLRLYPKYKLVSIEGHTDLSGRPKYNLRLSDLRAQAVKTFLVEREGIEESRLQTVGYGEERPWMEGRSKEANQKNRRVEFIIKETDESLPHRTQEEADAVKENAQKNTPTIKEPEKARKVKRSHQQKQVENAAKAKDKAKTKPNQKPEEKAAENPEKKPEEKVAE
jgi:outer membrane protein OmpA-like peptidoglycan-associated protein